MNAYMGLAMALGVVLALPAAGQGVLRPQSTLRITTASETVVGRLLDGDSARLRIQTTQGTRIELRRADVTALERQGTMAWPVAKNTAIAGAIGTAGFAALLITGMCENASGCGDDYLPGLMMGGAVGAAGGAIVGTVVGSLFTRWRPVDTYARFAARDRRLECVTRPRLEAQFPREGAGHVSIAAVCSSRVIVGAEIGRLRARSDDSAGRFIDPDFGEIQALHMQHRTVRFSGAFAELPLESGAFRAALVGSAGYYLSVTERWTLYQPVDHLVDDYAAYYARYPGTSARERVRPLSAAVGIKASVALGPNVGVGFATRIHRVGTDASQLESGITLSYRP